MAGVGAIIGGGLGAASSIFGGVLASKAMKKVRNNLQERQKANKAGYDRCYGAAACGRAEGACADGGEPAQPQQTECGYAGRDGRHGGFGGSGA